MDCCFCGKHTCSVIKVEKLGDYQPVCKECRDMLTKERIEEKLKSVSSCSDFKEWSKEDMSEAFWIHLGKYQKKPNRRSLDVMIRALLWACHDDHGLSNSFSHALRWCGIDWPTEQNRKDLPDTDE